MADLPTDDHYAEGAHAVAAALRAHYPSLRTCRGCGCTEHHACVDPIEGPCWWVEPALCSHCQLTAAALGAKIQVAHDLDSAQVSIEGRHALQLQKMTTWLLQLPTTSTIDQIKTAVDALAAKAGT